MAINFHKIPSDLVIPEPPKYAHTVLDEIQARSSLIDERQIKCKDIGPLYEKPKKRPQRYSYKYYCVCPRYNPQYLCQHSGNIIIDRDVLTQEEHLVYLSTPKANFAAPRKMPRYYEKKAIVPNCTARINKLAAPDQARVKETLSKFQHLLKKRHLNSLQQHLKKKPDVEYTDINTALAWLEEERRLTLVAKRLNKQRCKKLSKKIANKQRSQIKKIICVLFEEMKDFLLNDQFIMDERSTLVAVILETIREFTDKEFYTTSNLREYQKILAFNLAVWINKFISNLNIHVAQAPASPQRDQPFADSRRQQYSDKPSQALQNFLPVGDYISYSSASDEFMDDENEEFYSVKNPPTMPSEAVEGETEKTLKTEGAEQAEAE
ncbi:reduction in Cnn dots 7 [Glossina fuscipes fuscipes]